MSKEFIHSVAPAADFMNSPSLSYVRSGFVALTYGTLRYAGDLGLYWSSRNIVSYATYAYYLVFYASDVNPSARLSRFNPFPVRHHPRTGRGKHNNDCCRTRGQYLKQDN